jgi:hypothetical protein
VNAIEALALALSSQPRASEQPVRAQPVVIVQPVAIVQPPPVATPESPLAIPATAATPQAPIRLAAEADVLLLPPAVRVQSQPSASAPEVQRADAIRPPDARFQAYELARSLRDAALLAYRVDTGGSATSWPLEEADDPSAQGQLRQRRPAPTSSASEAAARPRPADLAAEKTEAR